MLEIIRLEDRARQAGSDGGAMAREDEGPFLLPIEPDPLHEATAASPAGSSRTRIWGEPSSPADEASSTDSTAPSSDLALAAHAMWLCRRFVESIVLESIELRRSAGSSPVPTVDWEGLWACARDAASLEQAIGHVLVEADRLARDLREGIPLPEQPPNPLPEEVRGGEGEGLGGPGAVEAASLPLSTDPLAGPEATQAPRVPSPPQPAALVDEVVARADATPVPSHMSVARERRRRRLASFFGWTQFTGILLFLFVAWQLWGTGISQHHAQQALQKQFDAHLKSAPVKTASAPTLIPANATVAEPPEGSVVGRIQIPAIGVDEYVVEGTAESDLAEGPGHYIGTAMPGQAGNVAIAGHRTTYGAPFYDLNKLAPGDPIVLTTDTGVQLRYVESTVPVAVSPADVSVLDSFGDNRLTLTTCNPRYSATQRLVAVALLQTPVVDPVVTTATHTSPGHRRPAQTGVSKALAESTVGWHPLYIPEALLFIALLVFLGSIKDHAAVYLGRTIRWLVLVPLWLVVIYLLFGALTSLLPATL